MWSDNTRLFTPAAIFIPAGDREVGRWLHECSTCIREHAWDLHAIVRDVDALAAMWADGRIRRIVCALPEHAQSLLWAVEVVHRPPDDPPDPGRASWR